MYQYKGIEDTIAAIATPAGQGGIGIMRLSGRDAVAIADKVLALGKSRTLSSSPTHTVHHGWVQTPQEGLIDEVLVTLMRCPKSYTGEDVVEINGHGGMTVLQAILKAVLNAGARLAEPGEFTKRAFLNGRLDLTQAEAVADIINAKSEAFLRQSSHQLQGRLSAELKSIREALVNIYTMIEALINFPEDGLEENNRLQVGERLAAQRGRITKLLQSSGSGRLLKEGIRLVLCGKPNVGKSSLLNALLQQERAIVTDIAGTTRDVLEESARLKGIPICLVDTAGILEPRDLVEEEAVRRSHLYIEGADLVLLVLDNNRPLEKEDLLLVEKLKGAKVLGLVNKMDLPQRIDMSAVEKALGKDRLIEVCANNPSSVCQLEEKIVAIIAASMNMDAQGLLVSNLRHIKALEEAQESLREALRLLEEDHSFEFVAEEIKAAINQLDAITGRNIDEDLLDRIFSQFCIGK